MLFPAVQFKRVKFLKRNDYFAFLFFAIGFGLASVSHLLSTFFTHATRFAAFVATPFRPPVLTLPVRVTTPALVATLIVASFREAVFASLSFTAAVI